MREIKLTKGYSTIVDDDDYEWLIQYSWFASGISPYAATHPAKHGPMYYMHRLIMERVYGDISDYHIDHINHNTLDNRKDNLRPCTPSQNAQNSNKRTSRTNSKYKGVTYLKGGSKRKKRWLAYIESAVGKREYLGYFLTEKEAALAYNKAASIHFGDFANLNDV